MKKTLTKKNKKTVKKRNRILTAAALGLLVLTGAFFLLRNTIHNALLTRADLALAGKTYNGITAIGMVNGEPFFESDLNVYAMERRAAVAARYGRLYNITSMGAAFWETEFDGETPRQFLENLALNDLVRNMVLIQEARKRGIHTPSMYNDLETEREAWNAPTDDIIYGPQTLAPAEYHSYRITGIKNELMTDLLNNELAPTTTQMHAAYDSLDDGLKVAPVYVSAVRFFWNEGTVSFPEAHSMLEQGMRSGAAPEELAETLASAIPGLSQEAFESHSRYVSREDPYEQELAAILQEANIGSLVSGPMYRPELFYIISREGGHMMPFEEAPGLGRNKWINDQIEIFLDKKTREARVTLFPR